MNQPSAAPGRPPGPSPGRPGAAGHVVLRVEDDPAAEDVALLDTRVAAFTLGVSGHGPPGRLAVFARDGDVVVGGIHGWTWGGCCELVSLWVSERRRGQGLGRALLAEAETAARERGCHQVVLFTHDVQGPSLYLHAGYELVGELEGYPAGGTAYWLRKPLGGRPPRPPRPAVRRLFRTTIWALWAALGVTIAGR